MSYRPLFATAVERARVLGLNLAHDCAEVAAECHCVRNPDYGPEDGPANGHPAGDVRCPEVERHSCCSHVFDALHPYRVEVIADNSGKWCGNMLRFPDLEQALAY